MVYPLRVSGNWNIFCAFNQAAASRRRLSMGRRDRRRATIPCLKKCRKQEQKSEFKMSLTVEQKKEVVANYGQHEKDTGSAEIQVALLTNRIGQLTEHLKMHKKDHASRRGLLKMVGARSSLLKYLTRTDRDRYQKLIERLGLRK